MKLHGGDKKEELLLYGGDKKELLSHDRGVEYISASTGVFGSANVIVLELIESIWLFNSLNISRELFGVLGLAEDSDDDSLNLCSRDAKLWTVFRLEHWVSRLAGIRRRYKQTGELSFEFATIIGLGGVTWQF